MREQDWLAGDDPGPLFAYLRGRGDPRRWRLFVCTCLSELGHLLPCDRSRSAFLVLLRAAETEVPEPELLRAHRDAIAAHKQLYHSSGTRGDVDRRVRARIRGVAQALIHATLPVSDPESLAVIVASTLRSADPRDPNWDERIRRLCCTVIRDVFGNPFHEIGLPPAWVRQRGEVPIRIAQTIYDERCFEELPILADALEDADCPVAALIDHCRLDGPHGRGCWAVDLLAGVR